MKMIVILPLWLVAIVLPLVVVARLGVGMTRFASAIARASLRYILSLLRS